MNIFKEINNPEEQPLSWQHITEKSLMRLSIGLLPLRVGKLLVMNKEVSTVMKIRTFGRHARESLKSIGRNGWMTFASVSAVTVTLILVGVFFVIMMNLNKVAQTIEEDVQIRVHIDVAANEQRSAKIKK